MTATLRDLPRPVEVGYRRWAWAVEIPWLPDLLSDVDDLTLTGRPVSEAFGKQVAWLKALAASEPRSAYQLRFLADTPAQTVRCCFVGASSSEAAASRAALLAMNALPPEFPTNTLDGEHAAAVLRPFGDGAPSVDGVLEVRRSVETLDRLSDTLAVADPVVLPWEWSSLSLLSTLDLLRRQPGKCVLTVHVEPASPSKDLLGWLQDDVARFVEIVRDHSDENPLVLATIGAYRRWMHDLPQGALHLRLLLASDEPLLPGLGHLVGVDLARTWETGGPRALAKHYSVATPDTDADLDAAITILDEIRSVPWQCPLDGPLRELLFLFDPVEANTSFRLPIAPQGGLEGVPVQRLSTLAAGRDAQRAVGSAVRLGARTGGGDVEISLREVNQHVLVAGLPGFGKTSTIQSLLMQLAEQNVPFLVIDPAKEDYRQLAQAMRDQNKNCRVFRLDHDHPSINPLGPPSGVDPRAHAGRILAAFDAALQLTPLWHAGYIRLGRALYDTVEEGSLQEIVPSLSDLYRNIELSIRQAGYRGEHGSNLRASLVGRIEFLVNGPLGASLLAGGAVDWEDLLAEPTIIELGQFAGQQERALIFALFFAGLVSYREAHREPGELKHITVLEEAHRVLGGHQGSLGADMFAEAIAELRSAGEGFIIAEQAPSMLHPAVVKLTGTKIVHRVVEAEERAVLASSMLLDGRQADEMARLAPGRAILYSAESSMPVLVEVQRRTRTEAPRPDLPVAAIPPKTPGESLGLACAACPVMCRGRDALFLRSELSDPAFGSNTSVEDDAKRLCRAARDLVVAALTDPAGPRPSPANVYCLTAHALAIRYTNHPALLRRALATIRPIALPRRRKSANSGLVRAEQESGEVK